MKGREPGWHSSVVSISPGQKLSSVKSVVKSAQTEGFHFHRYTQAQARLR